VSGAVFKIERAPDRQRVAYVRVFSGTIRTRDRVHFGDEREGRVTAISVFTRGQATRQSSAQAGAVAKIWGLDAIQLGDVISGTGGHAERTHHFAPPTLEAVVLASDPTDRPRLWTALTQLMEQDPLIAVRRDGSGREISVSLYGEVQKEVVADTLASDFGLQVTFRETTPICIERPRGSGEAIEYLNAPTNPFAATLGLRVAPGPLDSGVDVRLEVDHEGIPLQLFGRVEEFGAAMGRYVSEALAEGLSGWRVTDCSVTVTECAYGGSDGPPSKRGPSPSFKDFRRVTALVVMQALSRAKTTVCQPVVRGRLELPAGSTAALTALLARLGAVVESSVTHGAESVIDAVFPLIHANEIHRRLPQLTRGEGTLETVPAGYQPVLGDPPTRPRSSASPLNMAAYLRALP
jgi:ribosomal protection tetracycline resistance protein